MKAELDNTWSDLRCGAIRIKDGDGHDLLYLSVIGVNKNKIDVRNYARSVKSACLFGFRIWLGTKLMLLGGWITGTTVSIEVEGAHEGEAPPPPPADW